MLAAAIFTVQGGLFARMVDMMPDTDPNWDFDSAEPINKSDPEVDPYDSVILRNNSTAYLHTIHEELEEEDSEMMHNNSFDTTEGSDEKNTIRRVSSVVLGSEVENESQVSISSSLESHRRSSVSSGGGLPEMRIHLESTAEQQNTVDVEVGNVQSHMRDANRPMEDGLTQAVNTDSNRNDVFAPREIAIYHTGERKEELTCVSGADFAIDATDFSAQGDAINWCYPEQLEVADLGALFSEPAFYNRTLQNPLNFAITMAEYICTRSSGHVHDSEVYEIPSQGSTGNSITDMNTSSWSSRPISVDDRRNTVQDAFPAIVFDSPYHSEVGSTAVLPTNAVDQTKSTPQASRYSISLKSLEVLRSHSLGDLPGNDRSAFVTQAPERFFSVTDVTGLASVSTTARICAPQVSLRERSVSQPPGGCTTALFNVGEQGSPGSQHNTQATSPTETQIHNVTEWLFSPTPSPQVFSEGETNLLPRPRQYNTPEAIAEFFSAQRTHSDISIGPSEQADTTWASVQGPETGVDYDYEEGQSESSVPAHLGSLHFLPPSDGLTTTLMTNNPGRTEWAVSHSRPRDREMVAAVCEPVASVQYDHAGQLGQRSHNMVCCALLPTQASQMKRSPAVQGVCALLHRQPTELDRVPTAQDSVETAVIATSAYGKRPSHQLDSTPESPVERVSRTGDEDDRTSLNSTSTLSSASTTSPGVSNGEEPPPMKRPSYDYGEEEMGEKEMNWFLLRGAVSADAQRPGKEETCNVQTKSLTPKQSPSPKVDSYFWRFQRVLWCKSRSKVPRLAEGIEVGQLDEPVLVWQDACEKSVAPTRSGNTGCDSCSFSEKWDALPYIDNEESYSENWYITESQQFSWIERAQLATAEEITLNSGGSFGSSDIKAQLTV
ncbi:unnamed protein product [Schistocephalus solidus]|uniref:Uncharacterized protein n=1 Tax=Schistocephalus solidus TaxID=70667 RepID=A0A183T8F1_SCHSO|nr:unnamed protein product [Schistocephalus solidus]